MWIFGVTIVVYSIEMLSGSRKQLHTRNIQLGVPRFDIY